MSNSYQEQINQALRDYTGEFLSIRLENALTLLTIPIEELGFSIIANNTSIPLHELDRSALYSIPVATKKAQEDGNKEENFVGNILCARGLAREYRKNSDNFTGIHAFLSSARAYGIASKNEGMDFGRMSLATSICGTRAAEAYEIRDHLTNYNFACGRSFFGATRFLERYHEVPTRFKYIANSFSDIRKAKKIIRNSTKLKEIVQDLLNSDDRTRKFIQIYFTEAND